MSLTTSDLWTDLIQGRDKQGRDKKERAFGYVGTDETYTDEDGDDVAYCGWFFTWPDRDPAKELTRDQIEGMIDSLERDETESHREAIPRSLAVEALRGEIESRLMAVSVYWDDQDASNEGWAARKIGRYGESTMALDARDPDDSDEARREAAEHYGIEADSVEVEVEVE